MIGRRECQFELWEECNSRCKFCYLGTHNIKTPTEKKIENIDRTVSRIQDDSLYDKINCLAYIGGEFFQGQLADDNVHDKFMNLMEITNQKLQNGLINEVWISATLMLGDQRHLYEALNKYSDVSRIWILTSYDTIGRFRDDEQEKQWIGNLAKLRQTYKDIRINITSILTGDFIKRYVNGSLTIQEIANQYGCSMFLKPPAGISTADDAHQVDTILRDFYPTRQEFLKFLLEYRKRENDFQYDNLFNINQRSEYLVLYGGRQKLSHRIKEQYQETFDNENDVLPCGHSAQYAFYSDCEKCAVCDKLMIQNSN